MSKNGLSPLRRAFWLGYRAGLRAAWNKMHCKAQAWEDEIAALQNDYEMLINELRCARDEQAVKRALDERATHDTWLH